MRLAFIAALLISSCLASTNLIQTLKTQAKAPAHLGTSIYSSEVQWGGSSAPWNRDGQWFLGGRSNQRVVSVQVKSADRGQTLLGQIIYKGEGPIDFKANRALENNWDVDVRWGGASGIWRRDGTWVIGGRPNQPVVDVKITGDGNNFSGQITYVNEGPISFRGRQN